jgi:hypothetical protein
MNVTAHEGFDFPRWMHDLDNESRARLDRFLELTTEAARTPNRKPDAQRTLRE